MSSARPPGNGGVSRRHLVRCGLALMACSAAVSACSSSSSATSARPGPSVPAPTPHPDPSTTHRATSTGKHTQQPIEHSSASRPIARQLVGQRIIYSYPDVTPPPALLQRIAEGEAAGVIFFTRNIASRSQIAGAIAQLRRAQRESPVAAPLLLMTDQEGGLVRRLPGDPAASEQQLGQAADPQAAAAAAGAAAARNLVGVGMNLNLAPVLDVATSPDGLIGQYQRSYGGDVTIDAALGAAFIAAQQTLGIAATAKHFPGLGEATNWQNTDEAPAVLDVSANRLREVDELPYRAAIATGVKLIMLSWGTYPALDGSLPAGLSPRVVQQELRGRLGYTGVTITDALEAGALDPFGGAGPRAVAAASAGMDLILCSSGLIEQGDDAAAALLAALEDGRLNPGGFDAAFERIYALRHSLSR